MDRTTFWTIIDASRRGIKDKDDETGRLRLQALHAALMKRSPEEIVEFDRVFGELMDESYRADLWGAAYIINGGCSDDGFDYFRHWLISRGRKVYEEALANPDSLARHLDEGDAGFEEFSYVPSQVYQAKTGEDTFAFGKRVIEGREKSCPPTLIGDLATWSGPDGYADEARAKRLYPKLFRKFWD